MLEHRSVLAWIDAYPNGAKNESLIPLQLGVVNQVYHCVHGPEKGVYKFQHSNSNSVIFQAELDGLLALGQVAEISVPGNLEILSTNGGKAVLKMDFVESRAPSLSGWKSLAKGIACMHKCSQKNFGWKGDNFLADVLQVNQPTSDWVSFLVLRRIEPLARLNFDEGRISPLTLKSLDRLYGLLDSMWPVEPPALLHGDLWSGNILFTANQQTVLIDPAVYFGHREMDLAMTALFGDIPEDFLDAYQDFYPIQPGFTDRLGVAQLYPLLYHSLRFGGMYIRKVKDILDVF